MLIDLDAGANADCVGQVVVLQRRKLVEAAGIEEMQGSCDNSLRDATLPRTSLRFLENLIRRLPPRPAPCRPEPRLHGNLTATR
jgi:hypothetical protein